MSLSTFIIISGIFFWVLAAIAVIVLMVYGYVYFTYFKWNREDRMKEIIYETVRNSDPVILSDEDKIIIDSVNSK